MPYVWFLVKASFIVIVGIATRLDELINERRWRKKEKLYVMWCTYFSLMRKFKVYGMNDDG